MYIEALHNLRQDVGHPVKSRTTETLGATMALNMYEVSLLTREECRQSGTYCYIVDQHIANDPWLDQTRWGRWPANTTSGT